MLDNYGTYKTPSVKRWLAGHPRFHLHFTRTYSSWINQAERWFGLLTARQIRRGTYRSVRQLEDQLRLYVATYNQDLRPFTRVKTADEIVASVQRFAYILPLQDTSTAAARPSLTISAAGGQPPRGRPWRRG